MPEAERPDGKARVHVLVLVEDDLDMREVIRFTLLQDPRLEIVGETSTADGAIEMARGMGPGVIILDHSIEGEIMGLEAAPLLKAAAPGAKILLFTAYDLAGRAAAEPAIDAYLRKDSIRELLPTVLRLAGLA